MKERSYYFHLFIYIITITIEDFINIFVAKQTNK
jgi:hypothetical protein